MELKKKKKGRDPPEDKSEEHRGAFQRVTLYIFLIGGEGVMVGLGVAAGKQGDE